MFSLADHEPQVGDDVAVIGYPLAGPESFTKGTVSGLNRAEHVEGTPLANLMQTDAAIYPGNSGGPVLTVDGSVVGLVEATSRDAQNISCAVPATDAAAQLMCWRQQPVPVAAGDCSGNFSGPEGITADVTDDSGSGDGPALSDMLTRYGTGINTGDYRSAYDELSSAAQSWTSLTAFTNGATSSYLFNVHIIGVTPIGTGRNRAEVTFTSVQDSAAGVRGQTCSRWRIAYSLIAGGDAGWLIDNAHAHAGSPTAC